MPEEKAINLFCTHAWSEDDEYLRLWDYLGDVENFYYVNHSQPGAETDSADPLVLRELLVEQIKPAEVVIVLATQHLNDPELIELQMTTAKRHGKPLLAVEPFGPDAMPEAVSQAADHVVEWYGRRIVDAIKMLARGEEADRYEVIDWPGDL